MKKLFPYTLFIVLFSMFFTSCSLNTLEEDDLITNEYTITKSTQPTLYIKWSDNSTKAQRIEVRNSFINDPQVQLVSFQTSTSNDNIEMWQVNVLPENETDPIIIVEEKPIIELASYEPF